MGLAKLAGQPMMNLFVANDLAHELEAGGDEAFNAYAHEFLTATLGADAAAAIDRTHIIAWGTDPLTMGSYSAARVGKVAARATLAEPLDDRLYFAGEAISTTCPQLAARRVPDGPGRGDRASPTISALRNRRPSARIDSDDSTTFANARPSSPTRSPQRVGEKGACTPFPASGSTG